MSSLRLLVIVGVLLSGCGGPENQGEPVVPVSGTVTLDGEPVELGTIAFVDPNREPPREYVGQVIEGKFQCEVAPGSHRVVINWYEQASLDVEAIQRIPAKYNEKSELTAELKEGEPAELSFELKSN